MTALRIGALLLAAWFMAGCSVLKPKQAPDAAEAAKPAPKAAYELAVQAPEALKPLLEQYLDLSRFRQSADADLTDAELDRLVAAAPAQARLLLETEGYFEPDVKVVRDARAVNVTVEPGRRTTVDRVTIEAQGALQDAVDKGDPDARKTLEKLRGEWSLKPGQPFRQAAWSSAKNQLLATLRAAGYASANWSGTTAQVDASTHMARLVAIAESGPIFRIGELRIEGLNHHDERSVRNLAGFGPGAIATEERLLDFQERIQTAGLFEGASVEIEPDPEKADATPVRIRVRESPLQQATVGVGVSANTGPRLSVEHLHRRPFGWAARAKNKVEIGRDRRAWDGELSSHTQPGLYRNLIAGSYEWLSTADEIRRTWSTRIGRAQDTPRIERLYYLEWLNSATTTALGEQRAEALWLNYQGTWRHLDSLLLPTRGYTFTGSGGGGYSIGNFADNGAFTRATGRITGYYPLGKWLLRARAEAGQVFTKDSVGIPDALLFRAGGDESVRGYAYRTLGPTVAGVVTSGRVLGTASFEAAHPFSAKLPTVLGAVFVDAGNAASSWRDFRAAVGYGVGVHVRSPIGPLRVDLAYGQDVKQVRLHFSVGVPL